MDSKEQTMPQIDFEQLCQEAQEFLDYDPRFFDSEEGSFEWWGKRVYFVKSEDFFTLDVEGVEVTCGRP
ncbi:MAG: hypothetical protein ACTHMG_14515 [Sphingomonas sp.]